MCYPFQKPHAIIKSGSALFSGESPLTVKDGDQVEIGGEYMKERSAELALRGRHAYDNAAANMSERQQRRDSKEATNDQEVKVEGLDLDLDEPAAKKTRTNRMKNAEKLLVPDWYKEANPLFKLALGTTFVFVLLCIVVIAAIVGTKASRGASFRPNTEDQTSGAVLNVGNNGNAGNTNGVGDNGGGGGEGTTFEADVPTSFPTTLTPTLEPTAEPSWSPTKSPFNVDLSFTGGNTNNNSNDNEGTNSGTNSGTAPGLDAACTDDEGMYKTHRGKSRRCHWLTIHDRHAELYNDKRDVQCGGDAGGDGPSEIGRHCRFACRAYNGCLGLGVEMVQPVDDGGGETTLVVTETDPTTMDPTPRPTPMPTPLPTQGPTNTVAQPQAPTTETTSTTTTMTSSQQADTSTFIDVNNNKERTCAWLDIRNTNAQNNRRNKNCPVSAVKEACPRSCKGFQGLLTTKDIGLGELEDKVDEELIASVDEEAEVEQVVVLEVPEDTEIVPLTIKTEEHQVQIDMEESQEDEKVKSSPILPQDTVYTMPQDTYFESCSDIQGYFLNRNGVMRQCSWLIYKDDPDDDSRRQVNCGGVVRFRDPSDLGRMCRKTCGCNDYHYDGR